MAGHPVSWLASWLEATLEQRKAKERGQYKQQSQLCVCVLAVASVRCFTSSRDFSTA